jgi:hypothetical protein
VADVASVRFWAKVDKVGPVPEHRPDLGPCWLWTASLDGQGYGRFSDGKRRGAHVVAWEAECGPVPDGLELDHLCRVRRCVRVSHLEPVTGGENVRRGERSLVAMGRCESGRHVITGPADLVIFGGRTHGCRQCRRETWRRNSKRYKERQREHAQGGERPWV